MTFSEWLAGEAASELTHRFIETNGIRMHMAEQGDGPLVLPCHGHIVIEAGSAIALAPSANALDQW
jgi:hypothetical protein